MHKSLVFFSILLMFLFCVFCTQSILKICTFVPVKHGRLVCMTTWHLVTWYLEQLCIRITATDFFVTSFCMSFCIHILVYTSYTWSTLRNNCGGVHLYKLSSIISIIFIARGTLILFRHFVPRDINKSLKISRQCALNSWQLSTFEKSWI